MKWWRCRRNNNNATWIALLAVLATSSGGRPLHHDRWWLLGLVSGLAMAAVAVLLRGKFRGRRCP